MPYCERDENCREISTKSAEALGVTRGFFVWVEQRDVPPVNCMKQ